MLFNCKKKLVILSLIFSLLLPNFSSAAMLSDSYVIYENIHHTFDGPVISNIASSVSGLNATITWNTNVNADSFVVYSVDPTVPLDSSLEQGTSQRDKTAHSITLTRLSPNTTFYYRVKSTRVNGGTTVSSAINTFSIAGDPDAPPPPDPSSGGGMLIIDKTDKNPPIISNLEALILSPDSVRITWQTDEEATSFVEYGQTLLFGSVYGAWSSTREHEVVLTNMKPAVYQYRALSSDSWGNLGRSDTFSFSLIGEEEEEAEEEVLEELPEELVEEELSLGPLTRFTETALVFLRRIFPEIALNNITEEQLKNVETLSELADLISPPIISGQPTIEVGATEAVISWTTDIETTSQIAYAPEDRYNPGAAEPYYMVVGNTEDLTTEHSVTIYNLTPDTVYHFQLRSKPRIGPTAVSRDFTFATTLETLNIVSFFSQVINDQEVVLKWVTNKESDSTVTYTPYNNNIVATDKQKVIRDNNMTLIHEMRISDLEAGTIYDIEIKSSDVEGNTASEMLLRFSTSDEDLPPELSHIKAESTIFLDKSNKTQTIISWISNEPATTRVYYQEGVHGSQVELTDSTDLNSNYTKEHIVVITKFKPGVVYSFRVESIDSGGNTTLSPVHTFMTAKQRESIIQIIIAIFENTFSWVKKLM